MKERLGGLERTYHEALTPSYLSVNGSFYHYHYSYLDTCLLQPPATLTPQSDTLAHPPRGEKEDSWADAVQLGLLQIGRRDVYASGSHLGSLRSCALQSVLYKQCR